MIKVICNRNSLTILVLKLNTLIADALAIYITRTSATMVLIVHDKQAFVCHE